MHLAPAGGDGATGNDAAAVPGCDRPALLRSEEAFLAAQVQDLAALREHDLLVSAGADQLPDGAHRHRRLNAVYPAHTLVVEKVDRINVDHHSGSRATHARCLRVASGGFEHAPQD